MAPLGRCIFFRRNSRGGRYQRERRSLVELEFSLAETRLSPKNQARILKAPNVHAVSVRVPLSEVVPLDPAGANTKLRANCFLTLPSFTMRGGEGRSSYSRVTFPAGWRSFVSASCPSSPALAFPCCKNKNRLLVLSLVLSLSESSTVTVSRLCSPAKSP